MDEIVCFMSVDDVVRLAMSHHLRFIHPFKT